MSKMAYINIYCKIYLKTTSVLNFKVILSNLTIKILDVICL